MGRMSAFRGVVEKASGGRGRNGRRHQCKICKYTYIMYVEEERKREREREREIERDPPKPPKPPPPNSYHLQVAL